MQANTRFPLLYVYFLHFFLPFGSLYPFKASKSKLREKTNLQKASFQNKR